MALSADATWLGYTTKDIACLATKTMVIKNAATVYYGSLLSHDTDQGAVKPFDGTQTDRLVGWHWAGTKTGSTTAPLPRATIKPGGFIAEVPVTGLSGTATDYGMIVYATDDGTYTLTDPGSGINVGRVMADEDRASGSAWVYFRNFLETIT